MEYFYYLVYFSGVGGDYGLNVYSDNVTNAKIVGKVLLETTYNVKLQLGQVQVVLVDDLSQDTPTTT